MFNLVLIITVITLATWFSWKIWSSLSPQSLDAGEPVTFIHQQMKYQVIFLFIAFSVVAMAYALSNNFFGLGDINAPLVTGTLHLGIKASVSWLIIGIGLIIAFGVPTYFLVSASLSKIVNWSSFMSKFGGWIILISALNAFSEELIYRGALISVSENNLVTWQIALLSAVIFSLAHIKGQANGTLVLIGSAIIGWCLAYSVLQTHGLFWAWFIHFTQDIFIFSALIADMANKKLERHIGYAAAPQLNRYE